MRSHEERVAETKRRIAKMEREKRLRRNTITVASAVAACLALIVGVSFVMPDIAVKIQTGGYVGFETAASIFHGDAALGIHRYRASGVSSGRVRDRFVLPAAANEPGRHKGQRKRGTAWS